MARTAGGVVIVLVLGGTRSGKSEAAEHLAADMAQPVTVVATALVDADDTDMQARVEKHRARRPAEWTTVECDSDLPGILRSLDGTVLVESLGTWVARQPGLHVDPGPLVAALAERSGSTVVVTEEVGLSVHAPTESGRRFADTLGALNLAIAARSDDVLLVVAGRSIRLPDTGA
jgi:adenosylcobinamide kinase/adenosylcobinamide-phosphate guanylyltransferase